MFHIPLLTISKKKKEYYKILTKNLLILINNYLKFYHYQKITPYIYNKTT